MNILSLKYALKATLTSINFSRDTMIFKKKKKL